MEKLICFGKSGSKGEVKADFRLDQTESIELQFEWPISWVLKTGHDNWGSMSLSRASGLWQTTCFEAFVKPEVGTFYWEINLSLSGQWNIYRFDYIRTPQPPKQETQWRVESISVSPGKLKSKIAAELPPKQKLFVGLTAIIDPVEGQKSFWALRHTQPKPDLHDFAAFIYEWERK